MNIEHLKAFYKVSQEGSFTKAARTLYITQSAVSQQVQALEHSLQIKLFDRSGKKILLTSQGESLLSYAKKLFGLYEEIESLFELQKTLEKGKIKIASTRVIGTYYLPQIIGLYNRQYPGIEIDLRLGNSHRILDIILDGEVDFGIAGKVRKYPRLTNTHIHHEKLLIVSGPDHHFTESKPITLEQIVQLPFIGREKGTQTREAVKRWFERNLGKKYPKKSIELENVEATKRIVEAGYGFTIIPEAAVRRDIEAGLLKQIELEGFDISVDFYLFYFKAKVFSKAVKTFLKMLADSQLFSCSANLKERIMEMK